jgi:uncharacterized protein (DUF2267 family)
MQRLSALVKDRAGLRTEREARRAVNAAVGVLRCALDDEDARSLAAEVPGAPGHILARPAKARVGDLDGLHAEAERREGVGLGFAVEHVQVVFQVLGERLDPELRERLRKRVPSDIAALWTSRALPDEPPPPGHLHPPHEPAPVQTLSRSRPGSAEPIAEARRPLAHEHSVVRAGSSESPSLPQSMWRVRSSLISRDRAACDLAKQRAHLEGGEPSEQFVLR